MVSTLIGDSSGFGFPTLGGLFTNQQTKKEIAVEQTESSPQSRRGGLNLFGSEQFSPTYNTQENYQSTYAPSTSSIYAPTLTRTYTDARTLTLIVDSPEASAVTKKEVSSSPAISPSIAPVLTPSIIPSQEGGSQTGASQEQGLDLNKIFLFALIGGGAYLFITGKKGFKRK